MVNHGGLFSKDGVTLDDIRAIDRFMEPPDSGLMTGSTCHSLRLTYQSYLFKDLLWSDPVKINGRHESKRGISIGFGPDVAAKFLADNNLGNIQFTNEWHYNYLPNQNSWSAVTK